VNDRGGTKLLVISAIATFAVTAGTVAFFLAHPEGKRMFKSFLETAAGKSTPPVEPAAVPTDTPPGEVTAPAADPEALAFLEKARRAIAANDLDAAEVAARAALARDSGLKEAELLLSTISAMRAQADKMDKKTQHDANLTVARQHLADGNLDLAEDWARRALAVIPESPEAFALLGDIAKAKEKRFEEMRARRERADDLAREGSQALAAGDYDRAIELADQALKLDPKNTAALLLKEQTDAARARAEAEAEAARKAKELAEQHERERVQAEAAREANKDEDTGEPIVLESTGGPLELEGQEGPTSLDSSRPLEVSSRTDATSAKDEHAEPAPDMQTALFTLNKLDKAFELESLRSFTALLAGKYVGADSDSGRMTRTEEIDNTKGFFDVASGITVMRTTYERDIRVGETKTMVRSNVEIRYAIQGAKVGMSITSIYTLITENGACRISEMETVERAQID
jgi:tetratricopeptide (TPR) repeat protein